VSRSARPKDFYLSSERTLSRDAREFFNERRASAAALTEIRHWATNARAARRETLPDWHPHASSRPRIRVARFDVQKEGKWLGKQIRLSRQITKSPRFGGLFVQDLHQFPYPAFSDNSDASDPKIG